VGRRSHGKGDCAVRHIVTDNGDYIHGPTWCGEERGLTSMRNIEEGEDKLAFSRRMATCNKCSAAIGKARLKQIADRVEIETVEVPTSSWGKVYRAYYGVKVDGVRVGIILMDNGWGNPWELRALPEDADRHAGACVSTAWNRYAKVPADSPCQPVHSRSKEMLASLALRLRDAGDLKTLPELEAWREERRLARIEQDRQREEDRARYAREAEARANRTTERRETALAGLADIAKRTDLTNLEAAGLQAALDIINGVSA
jgi:hypothetical protein